MKRTVLLLLSIVLALSLALPAMAAEPKELYVVEDAEHIDLYDRVDRIPFDKLEAFFKEHLE